MSFGDHLEELRTRLIRASLGVLVAAVVALIFARDLLSFILQPALAVLHAHGQAAELQILSPPDSFVVYLKIGLLTGLIVSMPWVLYHIWLFVAAGLYAHERKFVARFVPVSLGLFVVGVAFMYFIVLPVVLNFFVTFSHKLPMPSVNPMPWQTWLLGEGQDESPAPVALPASIPVLEAPPAEAQTGATWIDAHTKRLQVQLDDGVFSVPLKPSEDRSPVTSQFGLNFYISFILALSLAFGLAFQVPVVVVFLVLTRLVKAQTIARSRRYLIFGTFVLAAVMTPPDVISQILLAIPVLLLFEGGLFVGRIIERRRAQRQAETPA
jgi:sec-independent protein translocase protein TatC